MEEYVESKNYKFIDRHFLFPNNFVNWLGALNLEKHVFTTFCGQQNVNGKIYDCEIMYDVHTIYTKNAKTTCRLNSYLMLRYGYPMAHSLFNNSWAKTDVKLNYKTPIKYIKGISVEIKK